MQSKLIIRNNKCLIRAPRILCNNQLIFQKFLYKLLYSHVYLYNKILQISADIQCKPLEYFVMFSFCFKILHILMCKFVETFTCIYLTSFNFFRLHLLFLFTSNFNNRKMGHESMKSVQISLTRAQTMGQNVMVRFAFADLD